MGRVQEAALACRVETVCRLCGGAFEEPVAGWTGEITPGFFRLRPMPLANALCSDTDHEDDFYPLTLARCCNCGLVQLRESAPVYSGNYTYVPSTSQTMLDHFDALAERFARPGMFVVDVGSNDGSLLKAFARRGCRVRGVEPAQNLAERAWADHIPTECHYFEVEVARHILREHGAPDLITATNLLGNVPYPGAVLRGVKELLKPGALFVAETPDFAQVVANGAIDMLYHEHFSYFTKSSLLRTLAYCGLPAVVAPVAVHGGSLRAVAGGDYMEPGEEDAGNLAVRAAEIHAGLLQFLVEARAEGKSIAGYGAPAKATVLLNQVGERARDIEYITDSIPAKQGKYLPGLHIPIVSPEVLETDTPDYLLVLCWNFRDEVLPKLQALRERGTKVVFPIPKLEVV